ncbi:MAG: type II toxin-antitoxin system RelE/ParE family toxin [Oscillospiraceae bacterium]|nr:type II toxin-antitoxin system RelE/ParE family toxin [Oscillospiraceae bacterium]
MPAPWCVKFRAEAQKDLGALDNSQQAEVLKALKKVSLNPLPQSEGGYGKPLRGGLAGLMKIKLKAAGLRIVYRLIRTETTMEIIVIAIRDGDAVYDAAGKRLK